MKIIENAAKVSDIHLCDSERLSLFAVYNFFLILYYDEAFFVI